MASSAPHQGSHARQLTSGTVRPPSTSARDPPRLDDLSTSPPTSDSGGSSTSNAPWRAASHAYASSSSAPSPNDLAPGLSTTASTAFTSPTSSLPVSPFASPPKAFIPSMLDADALASAEEGHVSEPHAQGRAQQASSNGLGGGARDRREKRSDLDDDDERVARKLAGQQRSSMAGGGGGRGLTQVNGHGGVGGGWWQELVAGGRAWRKACEKDGWDGVVNKLRRSRLPSLSSACRTLTSSSRYSTLRSRLAFIPPRRRALALVTFTLILLYLLLSPSDDTVPLTPTSRLRTRRGHTAQAALAVLTSSTLSSVLKPGYPRPQNKAKVIESVSNPFGFIGLIDPYAGGIFNPSVLVLPDAAGLGWRHLFVARGEEKYELIAGEDTRWESVVGCFLLPLKRAHLDLPYLARESDLTTLDLPAERKVPYQRCINPDFNHQTGNMPNVCRAIFVIDARMVIPGLDKALKRAGYDPPVHFREQTPLIREAQSSVEKNWSGFMGQNNELMFHVSLVPQQIYKYTPNLTLRPLDPLAPSHNCLTELLGPDMNRVHLHHATPLLRATLCKRGECKPDVHNTVMFGIIHVKYHPLPYLHYVRHVVTWNVTEPYKYLSVSRPLTYSGTNQADPIFTVSMAWDHPTNRHGLGLNHGFLDDTVIISFGVADYGSGYTDVLALDLLTDHQLCAGVEGTSLWRS
ncbi:hypothetical protein JCM8208_000903 [Rhodotorula glutinis]